MHSWIALPGSVAAPPVEVMRIASALEGGAATLRATEAPGGGLKRTALRDAAEPLLSAHRRRPAESAFAPHELDFVLTASRVAVSVQAGRAWTNNGALLAVLAAASEPDVDWLLSLVPFTYKTGAQFLPVVTQLQALVESGGVDLDLHGLALIAY